MPQLFEKMGSYVAPPGTGQDLSDVASLLARLSAGQRRIADALLVFPAPTYTEVAESLGLHLGTVHTHLRRIRNADPEGYKRIMQERRIGLLVRHETALNRAEAHSQRWWRRKR